MGLEKTPVRQVTCVSQIWARCLSGFPMKCGLSDRFEAFVETPWNPPYAHCPYAQGMAEIRCFGSTLCATADKTKCFGTVWIFSFYSNLVENPCWRSYVLKLLFWNHLIEERSLEHEALPEVCWEGDSSVPEHCSPHTCETCCGWQVCVIPEVLGTILFHIKGSTKSTACVLPSV